MTRKRERNSLVRSTIETVALAGVATSAFLAWEGNARAQSRFGDKGQLVLSGENLFMLSTERRAEQAANGLGDDIDVTNREGLLIGTTLDSFSPRVPQVGAHYFLAPSISIGATLGYEGRGGSHTPPPTMGQPAPGAQPKPDASTFVINPKVGYALMFNNVLGFWFRGGLGYYHYGESNPNDSRIKDGLNFWFLSLDAYLVVSPVQHFGFFVGPEADITFAGSTTQSRIQMGTLVDTSATTSFRDVGISAGLLGYFDL
jgi:hypothetical protein